MAFRPGVRQPFGQNMMATLDQLGLSGNRRYQDAMVELENRKLDMERQSRLDEIDRYDKQLDHYLAINKATNQAQINQINATFAGELKLREEASSDIADTKKLEYQQALSAYETQKNEAAELNFGASLFKMHQDYSANEYLQSEYGSAQEYMSEFLPMAAMASGLPEERQDAVIARFFSLYADEPTATDTTSPTDPAEVVTPWAYASRDDVAEPPSSFGRMFAGSIASAEKHPLATSKPMQASLEKRKAKLKQQATVIVQDMANARSVNLNKPETVPLSFWTGLENERWFDVRDPHAAKFLGNAATRWGGDPRKNEDLMTAIKSVAKEQIAGYPKTYTQEDDERLVKKLGREAQRNTWYVDPEVSLQQLNQ